MKWLLTIVSIMTLAMTIYIVTGAPIRAECKDGTLSHSKHRAGTCSHHGGVYKWR